MMSTSGDNPKNAARGAPEVVVEPRVTYWTIVWSQFRKNRIAVGGMWCVLALFVIATIAPLISSNMPLVWIDSDGLSFPLFAALFNRLYFANSVDLLFNLLLVLAPAYLLIWLTARLILGRARFLAARGALAGALLALHFLLFIAFLPRQWLNWDNPLYRSAPIVDYAARQAEWQAQGRSATAVFPIKPYFYSATDPLRSLTPPSRAHWLGADQEGRDVFARLLYGARISLTIGVVAVSIYVVIGVVLGALAGYFGGRVDMLISRLIEIMICFPTFFLILALIAVLEQRSIYHIMAIIGVTSWPGVARLVRAEFLKQKNLEYAQAALALGIPKRRIIFRHILPNTLAPVLVSATFGVPTAILVESGLAFLGLGDITAPSWGEILNQGRVHFKLWLILYPGLAIFFVVSVLNLTGEGLRDALDPQLRR